MPDLITVQDVAEFYGNDAFNRMKNKDAAVKALSRFRMAMNAGTEGVMKRALDLACQSEEEAYA